MADESAPHQPGARAAASVGDPGRLLHGEDPQTRQRDDATHWAAVYEELTRFKNEILGLTRNRLATLTESAREEVAGIDIPVLEAELSRLQARRDFWHGRVAELGG